MSDAIWRQRAVKLLCNLQDSLLGEVTQLSKTRLSDTESQRDEIAFTLVRQEFTAPTLIWPHILMSSKVNLYMKIALWVQLFDEALGAVICRSPEGAASARFTGDGLITLTHRSWNWGHKLAAVPWNFGGGHASAHCKSGVTAKMYQEYAHTHEIVLKHGNTGARWSYKEILYSGSDKWTCSPLLTWVETAPAPPECQQDSLPYPISVFDETRSPIWVTEKTVWSFRRLLNVIRVRW